MRSLLAIASIFATAFAAKEIAFSGSVGSVKGYDVSVKTGSKCIVEYQDQTKLGANCTILVDVTKIGTADEKYAFSLTGGVSLINSNDGNLVAQLNYAATLPNPINKFLPLLPNQPAVINLPKEGSGVISYNLPKLQAQIAQINKVCATTMLTANPQASTQIVAELLKSSGSDACVNLNVTTNANTGATVRIIVSLDLLNADLVADSTTRAALNAALSTFGVSKIEKDIDIGETIVKLLRKRRVLRSLSSSSDSSSDVVSDDGTFMLGSSNPNNDHNHHNNHNDNKTTLYVGVSIASVAVVGIVAGAFIVFRRRAAARV